MLRPYLFENVVYGPCCPKLGKYGKEIKWQNCLYSFPPWSKLSIKKYNNWKSCTFSWLYVHFILILLIFYIFISASLSLHCLKTWRISILHYIFIFSPAAWIKSPKKSVNHIIKSAWPKISHWVYILYIDLSLLLFLDL